jgi:hypothetical protein
MPRDVPDLLNDLEADIARVRLAPASAVRARGRARAPRRTAVAASGLVVVAGLAGAGVARIAADPGPSPAAPAAGPCGNRVDLRLPGDPATVPVRVLDGTGAGRDRTVAGDLRARGFDGAVAAGAAPPTDAVAILRYGPAGVGRAALVQAVLRRQATTWFEPARRDGAVEVVVGSRYRRLATPTEINAALAESGPPVTPPECGAAAPSPVR